jgi:hypothetical protein
LYFSINILRLAAASSLSMAGKPTFQGPSLSSSSGKDYLQNSQISEVVIALMTRTEMALKTLVYPPFNHLMWLLAREYFEFNHCISFKLYICISVTQTPEVMGTLFNSDWAADLL